MQDVQSPEAISDLTDEGEVEEEKIATEASSAVILIADEMPLPSLVEEELPVLDNLVEEYKEEEEKHPLPEEMVDEKPLASLDPDPMPSHSISDSNLSIEALEKLGKDLEANLEELDELPPQEHKSHKVLYMEDLIEEIPTSKDLPTEIETKETENTSFTSEQPLEEQAIDESTNSAPPNEDNTPEVSMKRGIPFEIYPPIKKEETIEEEPLEVIQEAPSPEYIEPDERTTIDSEEKVNTDLKREEGIPLASEEEEQEDNFEPQEDKKLEKEDTETSSPIKEEEVFEEQATAKKDRAVSPKPKTAFSSWAKASQPTLKPQKKKKSIEKKSERKTVFEVTDLFKESGKKKKKDKKKPLGLKGKKKKKKKEKTKSYAMESLLEHDDVISETLAELLAGQGSRKKAIRMYKRLAEIHPGKKEIYVKRIKELNKET